MHIQRYLTINLPYSLQKMLIGIALKETKRKEKSVLFPSIVR